MDARELRKALRSSAERDSLALRLRSIDADARAVSAFLDDIGAQWSAAGGTAPAIVANLRNGAWLVDPARHGKLAARYKSVDGHHGIWAFSLRRPNLWERSSGAALIDQACVAHTGASGRRRDRRLHARGQAMARRPLEGMPTTMRCWLTGSDGAHLLLNGQRRTRPRRRRRIARARIRRQPIGATGDRGSHPGLRCRAAGAPCRWCRLMQQASSYPLRDLAAGIDKPLRPIFVTPGDPCPARPADCFPIVCFSASQPVDDRERLGDFAYVQVRRLQCVV